MERVLYRQICKLLVLTTVSVRFDTTLAQGLTLEMSSPALQPMPRRVSRNSREAYRAEHCGACRIKKNCRGVTGVVSEGAVITLVISIISPPRVIQFLAPSFVQLDACKYGLFQQFGCFLGILQISTLHFLIFVVFACSH